MKKGFTLIELLAVIIILAVIALIATPIVLDVVNSAKESAAESSAKGFADAARLHYIEYQFDTEGDTLDSAAVADIEVQGERPGTCDTVTYTNGKVNYTGCVWGDYTFNCVDGVVTNVTNS